MSRGSKNYCFTLNNPTKDEEKFLQNIDVQYLIYQHEVGKTGTPHLQGYVEFHNRNRILTIKREFKTSLLRAHLESRRGTAAEAIQYCRKEGGTKEFEKGIPSILY